MRQLKNVLRLKRESHHSHQRIAEMLGLSKGAVTKYVKLAATAAAGLSSWSQIQDMDETALHNRLLATPVRSSDFATPDYAKLHQELGRKGMTLMLLWQEHAEQHPGQAIHSCSQFCENYRRFAKKLKRSMRQVYRADEKLFIDYAGPTVALADGSRAHIFVSALGAFYRRMSTRMDKPSANTAVAHKLARMVYFMLTRGEEFVDQGQQRYEEQQHARSVAALKRRALALGFGVTIVSC